MHFAYAKIKLEFGLVRPLRVAQTNKRVESVELFWLK